jgi:hypothetical protein
VAPNHPIPDFQAPFFVSLVKATTRENMVIPLHSVDGDMEGVFSQAFREKLLHHPSLPLKFVSNQGKDRESSPRGGNLSGLGEPFPHPHVSSRCLKERKSEFKMVVGKDIEILKIMYLSGRTLVVRFYEKEIKIEASCH